MELGESPAAYANDTNVWSIGDFLARTAPYSPTSVTWWDASAGVQVAQGLMRCLVVVERQVGPK